MNDRDLNYLHKSGGWEIGTGPSVVVVDTGMTRSLTTTTLRKEVYAFAFGQRFDGRPGLAGVKDHGNSSGLIASHDLHTNNVATDAVTFDRGDGV